MISINLKDLAEVVKGEIVSGAGHEIFPGCSIDSRKIGKGCLFIAIKGENKNGHQFIGEAVAQGAAGVLLSEGVEEAKKLPRSPVLIRVRDTLRALQDIAEYHVKRQGAPVLGITGSNGKSTVKEMASAILSTRYAVLKNQGNLNNHIGLPLTLLELEPRHEVAVLEMGMSGLGEIRRLCEIARPRYGAITNIGTAHLEKLGSLDMVLKAKKELVDFLDERGAAVLNREGYGFDALIKGIRGRVVTFGSGEDADYRARDVEFRDEGVEFTLVVRNKDSARCGIKAPGRHNLANALCAAAAAGLMGMDAREIARGLEIYEPLPMRLQTMEWRGAVIINDAYNANPDSMAAALEVLASRKAQGKRIFVEGDMLELGPYSDSAHEKIGKLAAERGIHLLVTFGEKAALSGKAAVENGMERNMVRSFNDPEEAGGFLRSVVKKGDCLLVKGSRGMEMERIIEKVMEKQERD